MFTTPAAGPAVAPTAPRAMPQTFQRRYRPRVTLLDPSQQSAVPAPLFTFRLPPEFSGASGTNRSPRRCSLGCADDLTALYLFLEKYPSDSPSFALYRRELERFLLWLLFERRKPLSSADEVDCREYLRFLADPGGRLVGRRARRINDQWVPFTLRPLSVAGQVHAATALRAAFEFMVAANYLRSNPWDSGFASTRSEQKERDATHACLRSDILDPVVDCMRARAAAVGSRDDRTACAALMLLRDTKLSLTAVAGAVAGQLHREPERGWFLDIRKRYGRQRCVEISADTLAALAAQWTDCNAPTLSSRGADTPLLRLECPRRPTNTETQRIKAAEVARDALYALLERTLRSAYAAIEDALGERAPAIHGLIQALDTVGTQ